MTSVDGPMTRSGCTPSAISGLPERPARRCGRRGRRHRLARSPPVQDDHVGDDGVERTVGAGPRRLVHRLAHRLAAAEDRLLAADSVVLRPDPQIRVAKPDLVAGRRAVDGRVGRPVDGNHLETPIGFATLDTRHRPPAAQCNDGDGARATHPARIAPTCPLGRRGGTRGRQRGRNQGRYWHRADECAEPICTGRSPVLTMTNSARSSGPRSALSSICPGRTRIAPGPESLDVESVVAISPRQSIG